MMKVSSGLQGRPALRFVVLLLGVASTALGWAYNLNRPLFRTQSVQRRVLHKQVTSLFSAVVSTPGDKAGNDGNSTDTKNNDSGYKFGDITRGVLGKFHSSVNSLTGKPAYEFGDLSKWLDTQAKERAMKLDQLVKNQVQQFTKQPDYKFGDITKTLIQKFQDGEYKAEDIWLFLRVMLIIGRHVLPPVAASLPVKVLMELVELSMAQSVSEDVTNILTGEVDKRMKQWLVGDKNYQLGDISKKVLADKTQVVGDLAKLAAVKFTEKDVYEVGDISKKLWQRYSEGKKEQREGKMETASTDLPSSTEGSMSQSSIETTAAPTDSSPLLATMDESALNAFEAWDKQFLAARNAAETSSSSDVYFQQWDKALLEANKKGESTATLKKNQIAATSS